MRPQDLHEIYTFAGESTHEVHTREVSSPVFPMRGAPPTTRQIMKTLRLQWMLALAAGVTASAQPPPPRGDRRPPSVPPLIAVFDTNHDRELSAAEIQAAADVLGKFDRNGDGKVTIAELHLPPPPDGKRIPKDPPPSKPPVPPVIAALDADHDGTISATELEGAPASLKTLDKNGDGELSPEELRPHGPPPRADGQGGGDRPQGPPPGEEAGDVGAVE